MSTIQELYTDEATLKLSPWRTKRRGGRGNEERGKGKSSVPEVVYRKSVQRWKDSASQCDPLKGRKGARRGGRRSERSESQVLDGLRFWLCTP